MSHGLRACPQCDEPTTRALCHLCANPDPEVFKVIEENSELMRILSGARAPQGPDRTEPPLTNSQGDWIPSASWPKRPALRELRNFRRKMRRRDAKRYAAYRMELGR